MRTLATKAKAVKDQRKLDIDPNLNREPFNYDGPKPELIKRSIKMFLCDMFYESEITFTNQEIEVLTKPLDQFVDHFFKGMTTRATGEQCKSFAETCKARRNDFLEFLNTFLSFRAEEDPMVKTTLFCVSKTTDDQAYVINMSELLYFPRYLLGFIEITEDGDAVSQIVLSKAPRFYTFLYKYVGELVDFYASKGITSFGESAIVNTFLYASTVGQIYEKMNPSSEIMEEYIQNTLNCLTGSEVPLEDWFLDLFNEVKADLDLNDQHKRHPKYVQDFRTAFHKTKDYLKTSYSMFDYYVATKATSSKIDGYRDKSIVASLYEDDLIKDDPITKKFDSYTKYESHYNTSEKPPGFSDVGIRTIHINNPSKFKPRAIHIGNNSLQDRCKWVHNRLQRFLNNMECDCMKNHFLGVQFLMKITSLGYRLSHSSAVMNYDFSNATDTLGQRFQRMCLELLFPDTPIPEFWEFISRLPKVLVHSDGSEEIYKQDAGQPQGLLGSFDAFSLAHHIIMLMVMKRMGLESYPATEFYRVVGDDSIINSIVPDSENLTGDTYKAICEQANWFVNDKAHIYTGDISDNMILDFAKTTVRNGSLFTPVPVNIGLSYASPKELADIAVLLWFGSKNIAFKRALDRCLKRHFPKDVERLAVLIAVKSGELDFLSPFKDEEFMTHISEPLKGAVIFCLGISIMKSCIFDFMISDKDRELSKTSDIDFNYAWDKLLPNDRILDLLEKADLECKYWNILEKNTSLAEDIQDLFSLQDEQAIIISAALTNSDYSVNLSMITDINKELEFFKENSDQYSDLPDCLCLMDYNNLFGCIKDISNIQIRSFSKRSKQRARFMKGIYPTFKGYFSSSQLMYDEVVETLNELNSLMSTGTQEE